MDYTFKHPGGSSHTTLRVPAETGKLGESVSQTIIRGLREEIAENENDPNFRVEIIEFNTVELVHDENNIMGCHAKISFLVRHMSGEIRKTVKADSENSNEIHGVPFYTDLSEIFKKGYGPKLLKAHGVSIARYITRRLDSDVDFAWRYNSLSLEFYIAVQEPTSDELRHVIKFVGDMVRT